MHIVANVLIAFVAVLHLLFMFLEMFMWERPMGCKVFGHSSHHALSSKVLAKNQGLYNGFLAAGLIWGLWLGEAGDAIKIFFLSCVIVAGVFGAMTATKKILFVQALPAALGLGAVFLF
ncbi:MAG: DUF1304 domain-containing protein [Gammaproteobacteria bacterium]